MEANLISSKIDSPLDLGKIFWKQSNKKTLLKLNLLLLATYVYLFWIENEKGTSSNELVFSGFTVGFLLLFFYFNFFSFIYSFFYYFIYRNLKVEIQGSRLKYKNQFYDIHRVVSDGPKVMIYQKDRFRHFDIWCSDDSEAKALFENVKTVASL